MTKHTPGPWDADAMTGGSYCICTDKGAIADVWTTEADAHLIAAAPEMYQTLWTTLENIRSFKAAHPGIRIYDAWQNTVSAVLTKAEGR